MSLFYCETCGVWLMGGLTPHVGHDVWRIPEAKVAQFRDALSRGDDLEALPYRPAEPSGRLRSMA